MIYNQLNRQGMGLSGQWRRNPRQLPSLSTNMAMAPVSQQAVETPVEEVAAKPVADEMDAMDYADLNVDDEPGGGISSMRDTDSGLHAPQTGLEQSLLDNTIGNLTGFGLTTGVKAGLGAGAAGILGAPAGIVSDVAAQVAKPTPAVVASSFGPIASDVISAVQVNDAFKGLPSATPEDMSSYQSIVEDATVDPIEHFSPEFMEKIAYENQRIKALDESTLPKAVGRMFGLSPKIKPEKPTLLGEYDSGSANVSGSPERDYGVSDMKSEMGYLDSFENVGGPYGGSFRSSYQSMTPQEIEAAMQTGRFSQDDISSMDQQAKSILSHADPMDARDRSMDTVGRIGPSDGFDPFGGPATPENPDRGGGYGSTGSASIGGMDRGGFDAMGRDDGGGYGDRSSEGVGYRTGGFVRDSNQRPGETVHEGEFVLNQPATNYLLRTMGPERLNKLNAMGLRGMLR